MKTEKLFKTPLSTAQMSNSELNLREFREGRTELESSPRRIVFELTNRCNFQCIMCGREAVNFKTKDLPVDVVKACEPFYGRTEEVTLHGWGEGTLHPKTAEVLQYLNSFPLLRKYFVTNGSTMPRIMEPIFAHHVDLVAVSLDGATPETNDSIRKGGDFNREVASIRRLVEEKARRGANYPFVNLVFTAMARNIHELPMMVELASSLGLPEVKVVYLTVFNDSLVPESLVDKQELVMEHFGKAKELADKYGITLKLPEIQGAGDFGTMKHKPCPFPWRDLYIGSDGFVRPCQSSADKLLHIGGYNSFEDIWNSEPMRKMRATVNDPESMPAGCANCYHSSCANWNLPTSFVQLGKKFAPEWLTEAPKAGAVETLKAVAE